jgi:hypothetical protein
VIREGSCQAGPELSRGVLLDMGVLMSLSAVFLLLPRTFFAANLHREVLIFYIAAMQSVHGKVRGVLIEIPILCLPLPLLYLGPPLKR